MESVSSGEWDIEEVLMVEERMNPEYIFQKLPEASLDWIKEYQISSALLVPYHNEAWPPYLYLKKHAIIKPDFLVAQLSHSTSPT